MEIKDRAMLVDTINKYGVNTTKIKSKQGRQEYYTTTYHKKKDKFYRIHWGKILDSDGIEHLWFKDKQKEVFYVDLAGVVGWYTKDEINKVKNKKESGLTMREFPFETLKENIVKIEKVDGKSFANVSMAGGNAGRGKTMYAALQIAEKLQKGKSVLIFTTEHTGDEVFERVLMGLAHLGLPADLVDNGNLYVHSLVNAGDYDENLIISITKDMANAEGIDIDFVIIDHLSASLVDTSNHKQLAMINEKLDNMAREINCEVKVLTQLRRDGSI